MSPSEIHETGFGSVASFLLRLIQLQDDQGARSPSDDSPSAEHRPGREGRSKESTSGRQPRRRPDGS